MTADLPLWYTALLAASTALTAAGIHICGVREP